MAGCRCGGGGRKRASWADAFSPTYNRTYRSGKKYRPITKRKVKRKCH